MKHAAMEATETVRRTGLAQATRSPVLNQFRLNPFHVLRVPTDVGVDQAIWKAEESLTRLRAGLPAAEPDLIPWLAEPDEQETRQAVQRIEEPLRRLSDQLFWFDPQADPDGELLRRSLAGLDAGPLGEYLASCSEDGLLPASPATVRIETRTAGGAERDGGPGANGDVEQDGQAPSEEDTVPDVSTAEVPRLLNQANLRLLLAALSLTDALPDALPAPRMRGEGAPAPGAGEIDWQGSRGLATAENPHELDLTGGRHALRTAKCVAFWSDALARWLRLLGSPSFAAFVRESIARLDDESVGEDDAETIVNATATRLTDLLVGELKAQLLVGRLDRVRALLEVAATSGIEPRRWVLAFRPLRPLFRNEAAELEPLLGDPGSPRFDDVSVYLDRLGTLNRRWTALDPAGYLGLSEIGDEAVTKACGFLSHLESYAAVGRIKPLYGTALGLASADSVKQRIAATVSRLNGYEHYACHFCRAREMELERSVVITGKRETHRTYGFNSTTIHYSLRANIIPRCTRCCDLHTYLWAVSKTTYAAMGLALAAFLVYHYLATPHEEITSVSVYVVFVAIAAVTVWVLGLLARRIAALTGTPRGERRYWRVASAKQYREMSSEGCTITLDYRRDAFQELKNKSSR